MSHHTKKKGGGGGVWAQKKNKGSSQGVKRINKFNKLSITWDEDERNDFVKGFHKRKVQRRHFAEKMQKKAEAEIRSQKRAEKREELRAQVMRRL
jgi:ribosomal RNA-processing protein 17